VQISAAYNIVNSKRPSESGKFYGSDDGLSLGAGLILDQVAFPIYDEVQKKYKLVKGLACVLTHECDIDQANNRFYNNLLLIAPIIKFDQFIDEYAKKLGQQKLDQFLDSLSKRDINRVVYIPTINTTLTWGGIIYLNQITHAHVDNIGPNSSTSRVCALSAFGLQHLDQMLDRHLFREKIERLPLTPAL
jgi:hypothetical protein